MGWLLPPDKYQKHRVIIELRGPVDRRTWVKYRSEVSGVIKKYGARLVDKKLIGKRKPKG
jgi:hypothetical protein